MICPNCKAQNIDGSNFCVKCGKAMTMPPQNDNIFSNVQTPVTPNNVGVEPVQVNSPSQNIPSGMANFVSAGPSVSPQPTQNVESPAVTTPVVSRTSSITIKNYFFIILAVILKPFTAIKEELNKFSDLKNSAILTGIVAIIATLASLIQTMMNAVVVTNYNILKGTTTTWVWDNLKNVEYVKVIGTNLLVYAGGIAAIAVVYYIASAILKRQANFARLLGLGALSAVPFLLCALVIAPLLSLIYAPLGIVVTIIGLVYTILILYEGVGQEIPMEGNQKYYFHLICLSILLIAAYYVYIKFFTVTVSDELDNILDLLK